MLLLLGIPAVVYSLVRAVVMGLQGGVWVVVVVGYLGVVVRCESGFLRAQALLLVLPFRERKFAFML